MHATTPLTATPLTATCAGCELDFQAQQEPVFVWNGARLCGCCHVNAQLGRHQPGCGVRHEVRRTEANRKFPAPRCIDPACTATEHVVQHVFYVGKTQHYIFKGHRACNVPDCSNPSHGLSRI